MEVVANDLRQTVAALRTLKKLRRSAPRPGDFDCVFNMLLLFDLAEIEVLFS